MLHLPSPSRVLFRRPAVGSPRRRLALVAAAALTAVTCVTAAAAPAAAAVPRHDAPVVVSAPVAPTAETPSSQAPPAHAPSADAGPDSDEAALSVGAAVRAGAGRPAAAVATREGIMGWNSHGPWLDISYALQKVIIAVTSATATMQICRIGGEEGAAMCALGAIFFTGVFELLKSHRICPAGESFRLYYVSHHPSYCHR
ncbi:hypothetical protein C5E16_13870 [Clavibacter michiganensis]|uniref:Integral membrane protein n=1 Tax=Clavibacter michiganensis TaxID=28447 RepID=A0A2S5VPR9_9MICO|nr:hypothetical protein [Clavibacter michiganensis]PPF65151.1 hypothetical protein C5E16_13870 [Clavibacter michiganensis]